MVWVHQFDGTKFCVGLGLTVLAPIVWAGGGGPVGTYYVTNPSVYGGAGDIVAYRGAAAASSALTYAGEAPVAIVGNEVRTTGLYPGWGGADKGNAYSLAGALNLSAGSAAYVNSAPAAGLLDGTSDGFHNYAVGYSGSVDGVVYQYALDWSGATELFSLGAGNWSGITYSASDDSFWLYSVANGRLLHASHDGQTQLGSFDIASAAGTPYLFALAMDVDQTLWLTANHANPANPSSGLLYHFGLDGSLLNSFTPSLRASYAFGGEIASVPEPATWGLWALGTCALWRRKKNPRA